MPELLDMETGRAVRVDAGLAMDGITSGRYKLKAAPYVLVSQDGRFTTMNGQEAESWVRRGYRLPNPEELAVFEADVRDAKRRKAEEAEFGNQGGYAFGAALARSLSFGGSDYALTETGLVEPRTLRGLSEQNPEEDLTGELVGIGTAIIGTGGWAGLAKGGVSALGKGGLKILGKEGAKASAKQIGRVGAALMPASAFMAAGNAVVKGAAKYGGATKLAALAAVGGAEGALYQAGRNFSDAVIYERDITGELIAMDSLLPAFGEGAAVAGGIGLLGGGVAAAARGVSKRAKGFAEKAARREEAHRDALAAAREAEGADQVAEATTRKVESEARRGFKQRILDAAELVTDADAKTLDKFTSIGTEGRAAREALNISPEAKQRMIDGLAGDLQAMRDYAEEGTRKIGPQIKEQASRKYLSNRPAAPAQAKAEAMIAKMNNDITYLKARPNQYTAHGVIERMEEALPELRTAIKMADSAADVQLAVDAFRREIVDPWMRFGKGLTATEEQTINALRKRVRSPLSEHVTDTEVYGVAADAHREINKAISTLLDHQDDFKSEFGRNVKRRGQKLDEVNIKKVTGFVHLLGRISSVGNAGKRRVLDEYFQAIDDLRFGLQKYGGPDAGLDAAKARATMGEIDSVMKPHNRARQQAWENAVKSFSAFGPEAAEDAIEAAGRGGARAAMAEMGEGLAERLDKIAGEVRGLGPKIDDMGARIGAAEEFRGAFPEEGVLPGLYRMGVRGMAKAEQVASRLGFDPDAMVERLAERRARAVQRMKGVKAWENRISEATGTILDRLAIGAGGAAGAMGARSGAAPKVLPREQDGAERVKAHERRVELINRHGDDPMAWAEEVGAATADLDEIDPEVAAHTQRTLLRTIGHLRQTMPRGKSTLLRRWSPSQREMLEWSDRWRAALSPEQSLIRAADGVATGPELDTLRMLYPTLLDGIRAMASERLIEMQAQGRVIDSRALRRLIRLIDGGAGADAATLQLMDRLYAQQAAKDAAEQAADAARIASMDLGGLETPGQRMMAR